MLIYSGAKAPSRYDVAYRKHEGKAPLILDLMQI